MVYFLNFEKWKSFSLRATIFENNIVVFKNGENVGRSELDKKLKNKKKKILILKSTVITSIAWHSDVI